MLESIIKPDWLSLLTVITVAGGLLALLGRRSHTDNAHPDLSRAPLSAVGAALVKDLPDRVYFLGHPRFETARKSYWANQQREIVPECVVKPQSEEEVATVVRIIKAEFDESLLKGIAPPKFTIRGGGHSAIPGSSNVSNGVVIDLAHFDNIKLADNQASISVGGGTRWRDISRKLDPLGLAVAGGRNGDVGVGGLTLGGGYSFFSPRVGFVCDNVIEYRIVLASGKIITASEHQNYNLWRVLKGGGNNFGIVISFTLRVFSSSKVWGGFLYMFSPKAQQVISAFCNSLETFDEYAAGPLVCITWIQRIGFQVISTHVMYTKPEAWPAFWQRFKPIGRIWSTAKVRTLTSATEELDQVAPAGTRKLHMSTVVKNDLPTLQFAYEVFKKKIESLREVKGCTWTLVFQPVHASTIKKGQHNVLGLGDREHNLVVVLFSAVWERSSDDIFMNSVASAGLDDIRGYGIERGTADDFCYLNWCPNSSQPFHSYGKENLELLKGVSQEVDPDGLFQSACVGGYKLPSFDV